MLYPGIKKLAKQLGLYSSGKIAFGIYKDFSLSVFDGNNKKILLIRLEKSLSDDDLASLKEAYNLKKCEYLIDKSLQIEFREIFAPYPVRRIRQLIEDIITRCNRENIGSIVKCDQCDNGNIGFYKYDDMPLFLCEPCYRSQSGKVDQNRMDFDRLENHYLPGTVGALLLSLTGVIPQILLFVFLDRMAAASSVIYCMLALKGYSLFKGKTTPLGASLIISISLIMTTLGTVISYSAYLLRETESLDFTLQLLQRQDIQSEMTGNVTIQLIVSLFYLVFEFFSIRKNWTFKTIEKARKVGYEK